jgi:ribosomal protein L11 methyltransferase
MNRKALWKISVTAAAEAEEAVAELLAHLTGQPASSYTDIETGAVTVSVFCPAGFAPSPAKRAELRAALQRVKTCGLNIAPAKVSMKKLRSQDWAESWKRHFPPFEIGDALLVKPSWSKRHPRRGQSVVVLDPGLSFGTGRHPTTAFCLRQLVARRGHGQGQSFLDIGAGSGILAIAAAKLGYTPVHAFDFDPEAVRIARANARVNGVFHQIRISRQDVTRLPPRVGRQYDLVCANLISTLLLAERRRLVARLHPGGRLVIAGILKSEFPQVQRAYEALGLRLVAGKSENEWRSGAFVHGRAASRQSALRP